MASILIIDDEPLIRSICQEILEQAGYDVLLACNGREGLKLFRRTPANLVITDVFMPERDGLEVIMTLHRESPTVPIIAFTGKGMGRDFLNVAKYLGAQHTIAKPFTARDLIQVVQQHLQGIS
jgi:CheY-like chemotaxis protein